MPRLGRRHLIASASALPLFAIRTRPAHAAQFSYRYANNLPATHPLNTRAEEAAAAIAEASGGRLEIRIFPAGVLGSDTDTLGRLRSGEVELFTLSGLILAALVPAASINGVGFAFKDAAHVWAAMDGALGSFVRGEIRKQGLVPMARMWDNGFRQITTSIRPIRSPDDLRGVKLRVPVGPLWTSMFAALGATPQALNFNELYSALQTHLVDGQENALALIDSAKLYDVQTYCSLTDHMWDGFWFLANGRAWERLPRDLREIAAREFDRAALGERESVAKLNGSLRGKLAAAGLVFNTPPSAPFRDALRRAGFYAEWRGKYGEAAWQALEAATGGLG